MPKPTHYIIVREDLPLGIQAAQIVHAVGESLKEPHAPNTHSVVLTAKDEHHLRNIASSLKARHIPFKLIVEPDEPCLGQATAIGVVPMDNREFIRPVVGSLPLFKERLGDERVS